MGSTRVPRKNKANVRRGGNPKRSGRLRPGRARIPETSEAGSAKDHDPSHQKAPARPNTSSVRPNPVRFPGFPSRDLGARFGGRATRGARRARVPAARASRAARARELAVRARAPTRGPNARAVREPRSFAPCARAPCAAHRAPFRVPPARAPSSRPARAACARHARPPAPDASRVSGCC